MLWIEASGATQEMVSRSVRAFFEALAPAFRPAPPAQGGADIRRITIQILATPGWFTVTGSGLPPRSLHLEPKLAAHCHRELRASAFWHVIASPETKIIDKDDFGWEGARPGVPPRGRERILQYVKQYPLAFAPLEERASTAGQTLSFELDLPKVQHWLEFGPKFHPPRPRFFEPQPPSGPLRLEWTAEARKLVRPLRGEGARPKSASADDLNALLRELHAHFQHRLKSFPELPADPTGFQSEVARVWNGERAFCESSDPAFQAALVLLTLRNVREALQRDPQKVESGFAHVADALVTSFGLRATVSLLGQVWALEKSDTETPPRWWIPGWAFAPSSLAPWLWFRLRSWAAHASQDVCAETLASLQDEGLDAELRCAAALAFPGEESLWRPHLAELCGGAPGAGVRPYEARVRLTSLVASFTTQEQTLAAFRTQPDLFNTYEYGSLVHALGADAFPLLVAAAPTDPLAMKRRLQALSVFIGPDAARALACADVPDKPSQKVVDQYFERHPELRP